MARQAPAPGRTVARVSDTVRGPRRGLVPCPQPANSQGMSLSYVPGTTPLTSVSYGRRVPSKPAVQEKGNVMTGTTCTRPVPRSRGGGARAATGGTGAVSGAAAPVVMGGPRQSGAPIPVPPGQDLGTDMAREWPARDFLEPGALPGAAPSARLHARQIVWEWADPAHRSRRAGGLRTGDQFGRRRQGHAAGRARAPVAPVRGQESPGHGMGCQLTATSLNQCRRLC
jgi:hypothetical protein